MRYSVRQDIALPLDAAFREIADVNRLERQLLRRGIPVSRTDEMAEPRPGMGWRAALSFAGTDREIAARIVDWVSPDRATLAFDSGRLTGDLQAEFTALSRRTTRLRLSLTFRAGGFRDRMFLQTLQMSRARVEARLCAAVEDYARQAEARAIRA